MSSKSNSPSSRISTEPLIGLRGFAGLLVYYGHVLKILKAPYHIMSGKGVMIFFTLSGFLMAYHYLSKQSSLRYWVSFLTLRFLRVYPAYVIALLCWWIIHQITSIAFFKKVTPYLIQQSLLLINGWDTFWTVPIELHFYFVFILCGCLLAITKPILRVYCIGVAWWICLIFHPQLDPMFKTSSISLWSCLELFIGGMWADSVRRTFSQELFAFKLYWNIIFIICLIFFILLCTPYVDEEIGSPWLKLPSFSVLIVIFILSCLFATDCNFLLNNRVMRFVGKISYSFYLTQWVSLWLAKEYVSPYIPPYVFIVLMTVFALLVATLFNKIIERPFHRLGKILAARIERSPG